MAPSGRRVAAGLLGLVVVLMLLAMCAMPRPVRAASPTPAIVPGGDTRSEGEGAGFVGSPLFVALAVAGIGAATAAVTVLIVRLTRDEE